MREVEPLPPIVVGDTLEYEVEAILRHQGISVRHRYLMLWKGHPLTEASWEAESNLANALDILEEYLRWEQAQNREKPQHGGVPSMRR